jgi:hypothetical protein
VGATAIGLTIQGPWVVGALINNLWSFAGERSRADVNQMLMQPFLNYNLPGGWFLTSSPVITANWEEDSDNRWIVPIGGGVGKIHRIGKLPVNPNWRASTTSSGPTVARTGRCGSRSPCCSRNDDNGRAPD